MNAISPATFPSGFVLIISTMLSAAGLWNSIGSPQSGNLDVGPYQGSALKANLQSAVSNAGTLNVDPLPFDTTCPFIWENDANSDVFDLELVMALANNGVINLVGISQSPQPYQTNCEDLQAIVNLARQIGWVHIPDATVLGNYYRTALMHPADDSIDSTAPIDTACSEMITNKVLTLGTASKPVVIAMGGPMTTVASAYLLASQAGRGAEFASKCVIIAGIGGGSGGSVDANTLSAYNAAQDAWAVYVCLQRLRVVITNGEGQDAEPDIWTWIADTNALPENVLTDYMRSKQGSNYPYYNMGWGNPPIPTPSDLPALMIFLYPATGSYFNTITPVSYLGMGNWPPGFFTLPDADDAYHPGLLQNLGNWNTYETNVEIQTDLNSTNTVCISSMNGTSTGSPLATYVYTNALALAMAGVPTNSSAPVLTIQQINPTRIKVLMAVGFHGLDAVAECKYGHD